MGIGVRGEYDEDGNFHTSYYFPYFKGSQVTMNEEVTIEKQPDKDDYSGVCDHIKLGVSLIFQLLNITDYMDHLQFNKGSVFQNAPVCLSALSTSGKVILPIMHTLSDVRRTRDASIKRERMIAAAREGVRVTLIERGGCLGGMWTAGLVGMTLDSGYKEGLKICYNLL